MPDPNKEIWEGDKLDRFSEAKRLERFLVSETQELARMKREQAFVLALDAQYGEGKSWFLSRFRKQLEINHPVAFVDAWVDDANNEPLVSIMAALDEALQPFLTRKSVKENFGAMARAALPIMGKGVVAAGGKLFTKYMGDEFGSEAREMLEAAKGATAKSEEGDSPLEAGLEQLTEGVSDVVDQAGKALLDQYRSRQKSREVFKQNLKQLAASINSMDNDPRQSPIFVVVDELDRCRPSYAISLLEEIKHLFDVPGVVFVIALHGQQLTKSIEAVYGAQFDATAYLRRFFTRHYELRRPKLTELVEAYFDEVSYNGDTFSYPKTSMDDVSPAKVAGLLLTEWGATPREVQSVIDALRLFVSQWDHIHVRIELPLVMALALNLIRGKIVTPRIDSVGRSELSFLTPPGTFNYNAAPGVAASSDFFNPYELAMSNTLPNLSANAENAGIEGYIGCLMRDEYSARFESRHKPGQAPLPTWSEYADRVRELGRFIEKQEDDAQGEQ